MVTRPNHTTKSAIIKAQLLMHHIAIIWTCSRVKWTKRRIKALTIS